MPEERLWEITRHVLQKEEEGNFIWYKVKTKIQHWNGKNYSETRWYSLQGKVVYMRELGSSNKTFAFGFPGKGEYIEETIDDVASGIVNHERWVSVIDTSDDDPFETDTSKLPCPCLGLQTIDLYTQGGSFYQSMQEVIWYARNIGAVLILRDALKPQEDVLVEFKIGNTSL